MKPLLLSILLVLSMGRLGAVTIDELVAEALQKNLAAAQSLLSWQGSRLAVDQARSRLWPQLSFSSRLTYALGGRVIDFPVGDLLNPVLRSINGLYLQNGQTAPFPRMFDNMTIPFLRTREQETRLRLTWPIWQTTLRHSVGLGRKLSTIEALRHRAQLRDLVYEVRCTALKRLSAQALLLSVEAGIKALTEHVAMTDSFFRNGLVTEDAPALAASALASLQQKKVEVQKGFELSGRLLNLLLNRPLESDLDLQENPVGGEDRGYDEATLRERVSARREELSMLAEQTAVYGEEAALQRDRIWPSLALVADYGIQGEGFHLDGDHDYGMASLVLEWSLFDGGERRTARAQAELKKRSALTRQQEVTRRLLLQLDEGLLTLRAGQAERHAAELAEKGARLALDIVRRKYAAGEALQLELLSAEARWVESEEKRISAFYAVEQAHAALERTAALYELPTWGEEE